MRIYMAQFFAEEVIQKSVNFRLLIEPTKITTSKTLIDRKDNFDDDLMVTFVSR